MRRYNHDDTGVMMLKTVIYADILIVINIIVNYLLLRACAAITGSSFKAWRFLAASASGGLFSLIIFIENIPVWLNIILKTAFCVIMILLAFNTKSLKAFLKCTAAFLAVNFAFGGIMLAVCTALLPNSAAYHNGVVYFDINILTLTVAAIACYCILSIISRFTKSKVPQQSIYSIKITYEGRTVEGKALFDSGNGLCDCFSGNPVIISENSFISPLLFGKELTEAKKFRLIPFSTISSGGALPAFLADKAEILIGKNWVEAENIYIGVTEKKIVSGGYCALFGTPFFDAINNQIGKNHNKERGISIR